MNNYCIVDPNQDTTARHCRPEWGASFGAWLTVIRSKLSEMWPVNFCQLLPEEFLRPSVRFREGRYNFMSFDYLSELLTPNQRSHLALFDCAETSEVSQNSCDSQLLKFRLFEISICYSMCIIVDISVLTCRDSVPIWDLRLGVWMTVIRSKLSEIQPNWVIHSGARTWSQLRLTTVIQFYLWVLSNTFSIRSYAV